MKRALFLAGTCRTGNWEQGVRGQRLAPHRICRGGERGPALSAPGLGGAEKQSRECQTPPPTHRQGSLRGACAGTRREPRPWPSPHQIRSPPPRWQPSEPARSLRKSVVDGKTNAPAGVSWPAWSRGPQTLAHPREAPSRQLPRGLRRNSGGPMCWKAGSRGGHPEPHLPSPGHPALEPCAQEAVNQRGS